jgi:hypothetical protein
MKNYFQTLFEHTLDRFNFGGIQIQDYVKILDTKVDGATEDYIKELEAFKSDDLNIKVLEVVSSTAEDGRNQPNTFSVVVGQEMASGLYPRKITVPVKHLKVIGYAQPPSIPDSWKHTNNSDHTGEPEPLKVDKK